MAATTTARRFEGRTALVTGGGSGIGRAVAVGLAREGARVTLTGRRVEKLAETVRLCREAGGEARAAEGDLRAPGVGARWVAESAGAAGLDILVNNAGVIGTGGILDGIEAEWRRILDTNLEGMFQVTRAAAPRMAGRKGAAILNVSSVCSLRPYGNLLAYCVSKAATDMFTQCLALELAPKGIRVNAVNPGVVRSELHVKVVPDYGAWLARAKETHPLGTHGEPEDVASLALFLLSDEARWVTGGIFSVDGGRALTSLR
ncbi:MAG: glucose 1-dehydrogenase [Planctomycetales bacterium]|nr:glucose 1-dehydrogenase [Planctomycetales bacterium]